MDIPTKVQQTLKRASARGDRSHQAFESRVCGNEWDRFIEAWAARCYGFLLDALGPFQQEPLPVILTVSDGSHSSGANASFQPDTGQICLCPSYVNGRAGTTLEKLLHEMTHASLNDFPDVGDPFYEEGYVDYSVWIMAHAPIWEPYRRDIIEAASYNIKCRRDRALRDLSDYDRKRWAGGLFCATMHGPWIISKLHMAKVEGTLQW
jgi:hypothetical protein